MTLIIMEGYISVICLILLLQRCHTIIEVPPTEMTPYNDCSNDTNSNASEACYVSTDISLDQTLNATESELNSTTNVSNTEDGNTTSDTEIDKNNGTTEYATTEETVTFIPTTLPSPTEVVTKTEEPPLESLFVPEDICSCDLTVDFCDINCCCDEDCTLKDRLVFISCKRRPSTVFESRYCYRSQFIYRNNSELKVTQNNDGFFCIVKDNLPIVTTFKSRQVITNIKEFNKLYERRQFYRWPSQAIAQVTFKPSVYKADNLIWSLVNGTLVPFGVPAKLTSSICQTSSSIRYLHNWSGSCSQIDLDCGVNGALSAASYYENITIVAMPHMLNSTLLLETQECPLNICLPVTPYLCSVSEDLDDCLEVDKIELPSLDNFTETCIGVVKHIEYLLHHNGTQGILKIDVYFWLTDIPSNQKELTQNFHVSFIWADKPKRPFKRSGNPGYIVGKPVLAGRKVFHISEEEDEPDREAIELSENPSDWLTIPQTVNGGLCDWKRRRSVMFGENIQSLCLIPLRLDNFTSMVNCSAIQKQILHLLVGDAIDNVTEAKQFNKYVATFGNSNVEETGDWVQILLDNIPTVISSFLGKQNSFICSGIVTSMHIDIVFAMIGSQANPQSKILGAAFKFGSPQDIVFTCSPLPCINVSKQVEQHYEIISSVSFLDLTKPPVRYFAEPPVYEVKLPYDFFYPFLSSLSAKCVHSNHFIVVFVVAVVLKCL
ncbi:tectonic-3 [Anabrus simplex]|uniref:tectonic-3 n=1 Tax=Anabrus simplex TaxID=316456 RepID=UPI0035A2A875